MRKKRSEIIRLISFSKAGISMLFFSVASLVGMVFVNIQMADGMKRLVDLTSQNQYEIFVDNIIYLIIVTLIGIILRYISKVSNIKYSVYSTNSIRERISNHIQKVPASYMDKAASGD